MRCCPGSELNQACFWVCHAWLSLLFSDVGEHAERCGKVLQIYALWDGLCINAEKRLEDWMLTSPGLRASGLRFVLAPRGFRLCRRGCTVAPN